MLKVYSLLVVSLLILGMVREAPAMLSFSCPETMSSTGSVSSVKMPDGVFKYVQELSLASLASVLLSFVTVEVCSTSSVPQNTVMPFITLSFSAYLYDMLNCEASIYAMLPKPALCLK